MPPGLSSKDSKVRGAGEHVGVNMSGSNQPVPGRVCWDLMVIGSMDYFTYAYKWDIFGL